MADEARTDSRRSAGDARAGAWLGSLHAFFGAFPLAYFVFAFITDYVYTQSYNLQWQYFSIWMIVAGLVTLGASIFFGVIDWFVTRRGDAARGSLWHMLPAVVAVIALQFVMNLVQGVGRQGIHLLYLSDAPLTSPRLAPRSPSEAIKPMTAPLPPQIPSRTIFLLREGAGPAPADRIRRLDDQKASGCLLCPPACSCLRA